MFAALTNTNCVDAMLFFPLFPGCSLGDKEEKIAQSCRQYVETCRKWRREFPVFEQFFRKNPEQIQKGISGLLTLFLFQI